MSQLLSYVTEDVLHIVFKIIMHFTLNCDIQYKLYFDMLYCLFGIFENPLYWIIVEDFTGQYVRHKYKAKWTNEIVNDKYE